jgi:hypothetical protein
MKFTFFVSFLFFIVVFTSAQEKENKLKKKAVPAILVKAFENKFLNAKKTKWYKEDKIFLAEFYSDEHKLHALYNADGSWQETHLFLRQLPLDVIKNYYGSFYANWNIKKKVKIESLTANYYLLEAHFDEMIRELIYDEAGSLLKEKIINQ